MELKQDKLKKDIDEYGYTIIDDFLDTDSLNDLKNTFIKILNYISKSEETDLQKKYYEIKNLSPVLKSHFYDLVPFSIDMTKKIHTPELLNFIKYYFKTEILFSGRVAIHIHDEDNDRLLLPHQETNQFAVNTLLFWLPLWDTNEETGGLTIFEKSHKSGYFDHKLEDPTGEKKWTNKYTNIDESVYNRFKKKNLSVKAGSAVIAHSALIHCGYPLKKKGTVRMVITERFNPLIKIPYLRDPQAEKKIPYMGVDLNKIID